MALLSCPNCGARGVGKVGVGQFYCWECCVEFRAGKKGWLIYQVQDDGSLLAVEHADCEVCGRGALAAQTGQAKPIQALAAQVQVVRAQPVQVQPSYAHAAQTHAAQTQA